MKEGQQKWLSELFERDLNRLSEELDLFESEEQLWLTPEGINNTAGNLGLHICGNLRHFIGHILDKSDYVRKRDKEFGDKNVPLSELKKEITQTRNDVSKSLNALTDDDLIATYPLQHWNRSISTGYFLIHLHSHLNYHLGQINYYRRLV